MSKVIRVLHICGSITLDGGMGTFLMNYYRNINREKIQFDFLTHNDTDKNLVKEINDLGGEVHKITPKSQNIFQNIKQTFKYINRKSPHQIIHVNTASTTSFFYLFVAKLAGKKIRVVHSHGTDLEKPKGSFQHRIHNILRPLLLLTATDLFACSQAAGKWLYGDKNLQQVKVIKNAIVASRFTYSMEKSQEMKKAMNLEDRYIIGHIGRFSFVKNHHFLIDVFNELTKINPHVMLLLIGTGELTDEIKQKVNELHLNGFVRFLGIRSDIPQLLSAMDVFILPSRSEGLPLVLIEAQAAGIKIFATNVITDEVNITDLVTMLSIDDSPKFWAEKIADNLQYKRQNTYKDIIESGYDIHSNVKWLERFYLLAAN